MQANEPVHESVSHPSQRRLVGLAVLTLALGSPLAAAQASTTGAGSQPIRLVRGSAEPAGGVLAGTFTTIQAAVNAALNGDTVLIPAGLYTGPGNRDVLVSFKNLTILGAGQGQTIVDCEGLSRGFLYTGSSIDPDESSLESLTIQNGTATLGGGIQLDSLASPALRDLEIRSCSADMGGGIHGDNGVEWDADGLTLRDNQATQSGGAIQMNLPLGTLANCVLEDNSAGTAGGGLAIINLIGSDGPPVVRISDTLFRGNTASVSGGAFYSEMADALFVDRCTLVQNSALDFGGAIEVVGDILAPPGTDVIFFQNSVIARNTASSGGGVRCTLGSVIFQNCTIADNEASVHTGGLLMLVDGVFLLNTILWGNVSPDASVLTRQVEFTGLNPGLLLVFFNDIQGLPPDPANISADPLFVAPESNDYHLGIGSPCINAGLAAFGAVFAQQDIDGEARVQGNAIDIGADERVVDRRPVLVRPGR